jgi:hypothetical protein
MSLMAEHLSYLNASMSHVKQSLDILNSEMDPVKKNQRLFDKNLSHVMSFQFFTPAKGLARTLNALGIDKLVYGLKEPIPSQGIAHNVHLLKDEDNHGYLTFQGTTNMGLWFSVHMASQRYHPNNTAKPFATMVDDKRWGQIEPDYMDNCHTGLCEAFKAFLSDEQFPLLAKRAADLASLTIIGHSFGGGLASMFARSVQGTKRFMRSESADDQFHPLWPWNVPELDLIEI